jgi:hypothetical protein
MPAAHKVFRVTPPQYNFDFHVNVLALSAIRVADNGNGTFTMLLYATDAPFIYATFESEADAQAEAQLWADRIESAR